jgi:carbamoyltransferase
MKNKYILGLNVYHADSAACLMKNGEVIFAIEEERLNRVKHWAGFPVESIKECLNYEKITIDDIDFVAINTNSYSNIIHKFFYGISNIKDFFFFFNKLINKKKETSINEIIKKNFNTKKKIKFFYYDHHLCHLASSYFPSGFDKSLLVSVDGFGDFVSTTAAFGDKSEIRILNKVFFPHSLGIFYQTFTQFLGFKNYGDEYKVMGLSAYGKNTFENKLKKIIKIKGSEFRLNLEYFNHHKKTVSLNLNNSSPYIADLFTSDMCKLFPEINVYNNLIDQEKIDLAFGVQKEYEDAIIRYISHYKKKTQSDYLSISGGCAMNSLANGKILKELKFKKVYIPPSPGDSGGATGASILCYLNNFNKKTFFNIGAYIGNSYEYCDVEKLIKNKLLDRQNISYKNLTIDEITKITVQALMNNKVVGWYQGRMEWGPRALGNRSIIANPGCKEMKSIINRKIKRRESFRPFAPSILYEKVKDWFEIDVHSPFMGIVVKIKKDKRNLIPAVAHEDGTGRLQTVTRKENLIYYNLIESFEKKTGIPMLLNTSFNENEPIVNTHEEALDCFLRTDMDVLIMDNFILERNNKN